MFFFISLLSRRLLSENNHYDEVLCVNIVGQSRLCNVLRFLAIERGLHNEVITVLVSLMGQQSTDSKYLNCKLLYCLNFISIV